MNVKKIAEQDAARSAYAEMFFGEGAGTRRKLLNAEIDQKIVSLGVKYTDAFNKAYEKQNFAKHAINAAKERQRIDHVSFLNKNAKALFRGDVRHVSPLVYVAIAGGYYAHQTGLDKKAYDRAKVEYEVLKHKVVHWYKSNPEIFSVS